MLGFSRHKALVFVLAAVATFPASAGGGSSARAPEAAARPGAIAAPLSPLLYAILERPTHPAWDAGGRVPVWVYLEDRGLDPAGRAAALDAAAAQLPERTARRRAKMADAAGARPPRVGDNRPGTVIAPSGAAVPRREVVDLRDLPLAPRYLDALRATGAELRQTSRWLNAASCDATPEQIQAIASLPFVQRVTLVRRLRRTPRPPVSAPDAGKSGADTTWSLDYGASRAVLEQIAVPPVHELGLAGAGVLVGVLDTGFRTTHGALDHLPVLATYDFVNSDPVVDTEDGDPSLAHSHGTRVLSALGGRAPGELMGPAHAIAVVLAKTEDVADEQPVEEDYWVAGLEWSEILGADVVSSSLAYHDWYEFGDLDGDTAPTTVAARMAAAAGVVVVNAAGNDRLSAWGHISAPADADSIVAVGAVDGAGDVAWFSSPGPTADGRIKPEVAAPGVSVPVVSPDDDTTYGVASGTSLSCPLVSGVAALMLERAPGLTPMQVREALLATASQATAPDNDLGWGVVNALAAVLYWGPHLQHDPIADTPGGSGPYPVALTAHSRAPLAPASLQVHYRVDDGGWQQAAMTAVSDSVFAGVIPEQAGGSVVSYFLEAADVQGTSTRLPWAAPDSVLSFLVQPVPASVLIIDDGGQPVSVPSPPDPADDHGTSRRHAAAMETRILAEGSRASADVENSAPQVEQWLTEAGHVVTTVASGGLTAEHFTDTDLVVLACGANALPVADAPVRQLIIDWVRAGGSLLVEGGEIGYDACVFPGYPEFAAEVLHADTWIIDDGGHLLTVPGRDDHPLLKGPCVVAPPVALAFTGYGDQDVVLPRADAISVLAPASFPSAAGALVHDPTPPPEGAAIVYLPFSLTAVADAQQARALVVNAAALLLAEEPEPDAAVAGRVRVAGTTDFSGVTIAAASGSATLSAADGSYLLAGLYPGVQTITATHDGNAPQGVVVELSPGELRLGVDFFLPALLVDSYFAAPEAAIPDADTTGLVSTIEVPPGGSFGTDGPLLSVSVGVDISHAWVGELRVELTGPDGTRIVLHNRSGGGAQGLVGTWPDDLSVDGPGSLADFEGKHAAGIWTLFVWDNLPGNTGLLHSWSLHLQLADPVTAVESTAPRADRLLGNAPNPFNPRTTLRFELARAGTVELAVFDARGRLVRQLLSGELPSGSHAVLWDGCDAAGRPAGSGTYLALLRTAEGRDRHKMLLVR
ncbi:MAG: S8 family serine peptidase [Candidatus Krumholzibacteriia bacterium]